MEKGHADLDSFRAVAEELTPLLGEVQLPRLSGDMLYEVVQKKTPTAGSLDGWGWREFKALPVAWFDKLASLFTLVEEEGVWPDGLLDAYIAMIPKADGDSTPLGQRPLCVLPIAYRFWASVRLLHLGEWFKSWVPESVFSAGRGAVRLRPGILRLLTSKNPCLVLWILMFISLWRMSSNPLIRLIGVSWITSLVGWGCLVGFGMPILNTMLELGSALSSLAGLGKLGLEMVGSLRVAPLVWFSSLPCTCLGVGTWKPLGVSSRSYMRII